MFLLVLGLALSDKQSISRGKHVPELQAASNVREAFDGFSADDHFLSVEADGLAHEALLETTEVADRLGVGAQALLEAQLAAARAKAAEASAKVAALEQQLSLVTAQKLAEVTTGLQKQSEEAVSFAQLHDLAGQKKHGALAKMRGFDDLDKEFLFTRDDLTRCITDHFEGVFNSVIDRVEITLNGQKVLLAKVVADGQLKQHVQDVLTGMINQGNIFEAGTDDKVTKGRLEEYRSFGQHINWDEFGLGGIKTTTGADLQDLALDICSLVDFSMDFFGFVPENGSN